MAMFAKKVTVHVRYDGKSYDLPLEDLRVAGAAADDEVRSALARHFDTSASAFARHVVERHATGNLTVRPEAVFG